MKRLAGLERHPQDNQPLSDHDLLAEYHRVALELGDVPTWPVFAARAGVSPDTVRKRFGGTQGTLRRYREWLSANEPGSPMVEKLHARSRHEFPAPPTAAPAPTGIGARAWAKTPGLEFGPPIDFRGLRHAPINEDGVIFLFGMISYELGFIVEAVHASFPDCEAKRIVDRQRNRWQRVRIEFEYQSATFREHGHDPSQCDLIVCWEHNWPDCPLEVIELRGVIDRLEG